MKWISKFIKAAIILFFLLCTIPISSFARAELTFNLDFGQDGFYENSWPLAQDEEVSIDIYVSNVPEPGLRAMGFVINYDSNRLQVVSEGTLVETTIWTDYHLDRSIPGRIDMAGFHTTEGYSGDNIKIGTLKFQCIDPGESELWLFDRGEMVDSFVLADEVGTVLDEDIAGGVLLAEITTQTDLSITKTDDPDPVTVGDLITYTVTVMNLGPSEAVNVTLTDNVPSQLQNPEYSVNDGQDWSGWTGTLALGNIDVGISKQLKIRAYVPLSALGTIKNTAYVQSDTVDLELSNNSSQEVKTNVILKKGDINGDGLIDLKDLLIALKVHSRQRPNSVYLMADMNGDCKIGIMEAIYILQLLAEKR